jgi:hypothetical protein
LFRGRRTDCADRQVGACRGERARTPGLKKNTRVLLASARSMTHSSFGDRLSLSKPLPGCGPPEKVTSFRFGKQLHTR